MRKAGATSLKKEADSDEDDEGLVKDRQIRERSGSPNRFVDKARIEKPYGDKK